MIVRIELDYTLRRVGALALTRHARLSRSRELRKGLESVVSMLAEDVQLTDTPARKEARRQLRIETAALLAEIETAVRDPTDANQSGVNHRAKAWNILLRRFQLTLGIAPAAAALRREPPGIAVRPRQFPLQGGGYADKHL